MAEVAAAGAFLALWNGIDPARDAEYNEWHAREHVPERLSVPGMLRARRYVARDDTTLPYFTLYEMVSTAVLASAPFRALLDHPTPWSSSLRPSFRHLLRLPCRSLASHAVGIGGALATFEVHAAAAVDDAAWADCIGRLAALEGVVGIHAGREDAAQSALPWRDASASPGPEGEACVVLLEAQEPRHLAAHHDAVLRRLHELPRPGTAAATLRVVSRHYTLLSMHTA